MQVPITQTQVDEIRRQLIKHQLVVEGAIAHCDDRVLHGLMYCLDDLRRSINPVLDAADEIGLEQELRRA